MDMTKYEGAESKYLKASDLQGKRPRVIIEDVELVTFDDPDKGKVEKPALKLKNREKRVVVSPTAVRELNSAFGHDSESWKGKEIGLSTKFYDGLGKEGIVITPIVEADPNDDIPF